MWSTGRAIQDISNSLSLYRYWKYSALLKLQQDHKKTALSFLWEPLTVFFVAAVLATVWGRILESENRIDYFAYIAVGFAIWSLLFAKLINRGVAALCIRSHELSTSVRLAHNGHSLLLCLAGRHSLQSTCTKQLRESRSLYRA